MSLALSLLAYATAAVLLAFSLRRAVLLITACLPRPPDHPTTGLPDILILIPCRNEAASLPGLFDSLDRLDYPREQMRVVIVDDGSTDDTSAAAARLAALLQPKVVIPHHWDDYFPPLSEMSNLTKFETVLNALAPGVRVYKPIIGQSFNPINLLFQR